MPLDAPLPFVDQTAEVVLVLGLSIVFDQIWVSPVRGSARWRRRVRRRRASQGWPRLSASRSDPTSPERRGPVGEPSTVRQQCQAFATPTTTPRRLGRTT